MLVLICQDLLAPLHLSFCSLVCCVCATITIMEIMMMDQALLSNGTSGISTRYFTLHLIPFTPYFTHPLKSSF